MSMPEVVRVQDVSKVFKLHRDTSVLDRGVPVKFEDLGNVLNADDFRH